MEKYIYDLTFRIYLPNNLCRHIFRFVRRGQYNYFQKLRKGGSEKYSLKFFDQHKCIFVHIPKTGGVTISQCLFRNLSGGHAKICTYHMVFDQIEFNNYFKFTMVRNPWDRLVSAYTFLKLGGMDAHDKLWADRYLSKYNNFTSFIKGWLTRKNIYKKKHFVPQYNFVCSRNLKLLVDFVGYFESFEKDFEIIKKKLNIKCELEHLNKSKRKNYLDYYDDETKNIVANVYSEDIKIFGYDFKGKLKKEK